MGLGGILIIVGLAGLWEGWGSWYSGKPSPGERWWQNAAGGERIGGFLIMILGAICVLVGLVVVLVDLVS